MLALLVLVLSTAEARVQRDLLRRPNTRVAAQWTLSDWLDDQNQASLLNGVLAYDRATDWYEFNVSTRYGRATRAGKATEDQVNVDADAYLYILNAHGEWQQSSKTRDASAVAAGLRLVGTSTRTTNLVARYGWRRQRDDEVSSKTLEYRFVEGEAQLYVSSWFGLSGGYRHYEPKGSRVQGTLFVEVLPFRVQAGFEREELADQIREVWNGGVKAFF